MSVASDSSATSASEFALKGDAASASGERVDQGTGTRVGRDLLHRFGPGESYVVLAHENLQVY